MAKKCRELGIDAAMLADIDAEGEEFDQICAELGVEGVVCVRCFVLLVSSFVC